MYQYTKQFILHQAGTNFTQYLIFYQCYHFIISPSPVTTSMLKGSFLLSW